METQVPGGIASFLLNRPPLGHGDKGFVLGLLEAEKVLMVRSSGFSQVREGFRAPDVPGLTS